MKRTSFLPQLVLILSLIVFAASSSRGAVIGYDYSWQYVPNTSNPSTGSFVSTARFVGNAVVNIEGVHTSIDHSNRLFNFTIDNGSARTFLLSNGVADYAPSYTNNGLGTMIEMKAIVNEQFTPSAFVTMLTVSNAADTTRSYNFILGANKVGFVKNLDGEDFATPYTIAFDTTSSLNVYQIYLQYNSASLYINGVLVISGASYTGGATARMELGVAAVGAAARPGAGDVSYEYIAWSNNVIPEPSTFALVALSGISLILSRL